MLTLMEEMKPVVLVKYEFEYREKLKFEGSPWNFRTIRILTEGTMIFLLNIRLQVLCYRSSS